MTIPLWVLLGFAMWTLAILLFGIGIRRWALILTGGAQVADFPGDEPHGSAAYRRATRAHLNCVENLPIYGAIAVASFAAHVDTPRIDLLAIVLLVARIAQSTVHMAFPVTNTTVAVRFTFFLVQIVCMIWMAVVIAIRAAG